MAENNRIAELEAQLNLMNKGYNNSFSDFSTPINTFWKRYDDTVSRMSMEQLQWVSEQNEVIEAKNAMFSAFFDFLFEQNKEMFVSLDNGRYKEIVNKYIDTIQNVSNNFVSHTKNLEEQVKELQEKLKVLEQQKNLNSSKTWEKNNNGNK